MIQLEQLHIDEFRGIRRIDLHFGSKSYVVHGPNGSGKSGIVDAIEFALTGSVARLSGAGTAGVTITRHGPHVHRRDDAGAAKVSLTVKDSDSGAVATITRSVENPGTYTLNPDTPVMREALLEAMEHPELTLSRRELIKYIVAKPGDRATQVQALLGLERVEALRRMLKSASSKASAEAREGDTEQSLAEQSFQQHLGLGTLLSGEVLREINNRRKTLGLTELTELAADSDILQGSSERRKSDPFNLVAARREVAALRDAIDNDDAITTAHDELRRQVAAVRENPSMMDSIRHRNLLDLGLAAIAGASCPLCETVWETREVLETHIRGRIAATETAQTVKAYVVEAADEYKHAVRKLREQAEQVAPSARAFSVAELPYLLKAWADSLSHIEGALGSFEAVIADDGPHSENAHVPPEAITISIVALANSLDNAPDESTENAAQTFLDVAKDRWTRVRLARIAADQSGRVKRAAEAAYANYCHAADGALAALYETVERDFSRYYQCINADDEGTFRARLSPTLGSLDLNVDFYGLGMFPPVAYHSEGHQDGMGICLYLALVKQILGDSFKYAVLDDVVMSVDSNHRRSFAGLLKSEFPEVQFVITTHDEVWARQMVSAGLVEGTSVARFFGWTVDAGPMYGSGDTWSAIDSDLNRGDVAGAAHKLRRMLEASAADIAASIRGNVVYRSDAAYDLSMFLDSIKGRHGKLLNMAAKAAQSWGNQQQVQLVERLKGDRDKVLASQNAESWLLNKLVHNNDWVSGTETDFSPVLAAARDFLSLFRCGNPECASWIWVTGSLGNEESLRCACQDYNLNLKKR